jgi:hypothetical protein
MSLSPTLEMSMFSLMFIRDDHLQHLNHLLLFQHFWISYFLIDKCHLHNVFVFLAQKVYRASFVFTQHVHLTSSIKSPLFNHHIFHLWSSFQILAREFQPTCWTRFVNVPTNGVRLGFMIKIPCTQTRHEL